MFSIASSFAQDCSAWKITTDNVKQMYFATAMKNMPNRREWAPPGTTDIIW